MKKTICCLLFGLFCVWIGLAQADSPKEGTVIKAVIRNTLDRDPQPEDLWLGCELIRTSQDLIRFYKDRSFRPVWVCTQGLRPLGRELVKLLQKTEDHGLNPEDYHLACIRGLVEFLDKLKFLDGPLFTADPALVAQLDILLTDGFLVSLSHMATGRVSPATLYTQWLSPEKKADILSSLKELKTLQDLFETYERFYPSCQRYQELLQAGRRLETISRQGGWILIPEGPLLRPGQSEARVGLLKKRLSQDFGQQDPVSEGRLVYDAQLETAVRQFQKLHGLKTDGIIGNQTIKALNVSARERWQTVLVNLERLRWLSCDFGDQYLYVNTAAFTLQAFRKGEEKRNFRVIIGKKYQKTPVFKEELRYIVLNPYWNVPHSIATQEILPKVKNNSAYLAREHIQVLSGWKNPEVLNPDDIDWSVVEPGNFSWRFRQLPGPWNSLGRIKFIFPNQFHVYIHDTPNQELFKRVERAFSHGCIRVQHPLQLAAFILEKDPKWTEERLGEVLASQERTVVIPPEAFVVDLTYSTAWVDAQGLLHFRKDIYERDEVLWQALKKDIRNEESPLDSFFEESDLPS